MNNIFYCEMMQMPLFFFDIELGDKHPIGQEAAPSKEAESVARHFHEKVRVVSIRPPHSAEAKEAERANIEQTETDTISTTKN